MPETNTTAWGDESARMRAKSPMYLMAACVLNDESDSVIAKLTKLKPKGAKKLHWRDMGQKMQKESLGIIGAIEHRMTVIATCPLNEDKQERARKKCLEALLTHLETAGVQNLVLESRGKNADKKDIECLFYLRRSGAISTIDLTHAEGCKERNLCIADQILGAYGDQTTNEDADPIWQREWDAIEKKLTLLQRNL